MNWQMTACKQEHLPSIAAKMREADRREVWASQRHRPLEALEASLALSDLAWCALIDGQPALAFGCARLGSLLSTTGSPWLLATAKIYQLRTAFLRQSRAYLALMQERYARLENLVHAENRLSLRWLAWLGFTLEKEPRLSNGEKFYRFYWEREKNCARN